MRKLFAWSLVCASMMMVSSCTAQAPSGNDWILPYSVVTPGATNPDVTPMNIQETICKRGWTRTIRPSLSYIWKLKTKQLKGDYRALAEVFGSSTKSFEEDHLIPLSLGGHPSDARNLFPQPYAGKNAHYKDKLEYKLRKLVCDGNMKLDTAQKLFAENWVTAYTKYIGE